jgi:hypothetical protein
MRSLVLIGVLLLVLLMGCGNEGTGRRASDAPDTADVRVGQFFDLSKGMYIEGFRSYVRIESLDGDTLIQEQLDEPEGAGEDVLMSAATLRVDPGLYRVVSFLRPCDGNCGSLDPPADQCSHELEVEPGRSVDVHVAVTLAESCTIEIRSAES